MSTKPHISPSDQSGFTLIELLIAMTMSLLVAAAAVMFLISIMHRQPKTTSSADAIGTARIAVEKITDDVRVGEEANTLRPSELKVKAKCSQVGASGNGSCEVAYSCFQPVGAMTYECQRSVSGGAPVIVASGLATGEVFCVYPTPTAGSECGPQEAGEPPKYVGVKIEVPNSEGSVANTVVEDGAALHNAPGLLGG
jgi:prepilin-type N-terminal cleavage/methylation domain-containing protein